METMHQYQHPCDVSQCAAVPHPVPDIRGHVAGVGEGRHVADDLLPVEGVDVVPGGGQHRGQGQPVGLVIVHPAGDTSCKVVKSNFHNNEETVKIGLSNL